MTIIFVTALYSLACMGLGALCTRIFLDTSECDSFALQFGIGSAILSAGWILVSLMGLLIPLVVWATILPLATYAVVTYRHVRPAWVAYDFRFTSTVFWASFAVVSAVLLWHGILAFYRPPFGDADAFYMTYPKIIAGSGRLTAMGFTYHDFSSVGLSGELHFAALMAIKSDVAAKLFAWVTGLGIVFLSMQMTGKLGGGRLAKLLVAAALATSTTVTDYLSDGKTELFAALTALSVVSLIVNSPKAICSARGAAFIGILTGIMAYSKFSYIVCMLPTVFALAYWTWNGLTKERAQKRFATQLAFAGAGLCIGLLPHLIKNWLLFANAAAPFIGKKNWADQAQWFSATDTAWIIGTFPFSLVFGRYPLMGGGLSLIWLMALPFTIFLLLKPEALKTQLVRVSLCALLGLVCWLLVKPSIFAPRYFLPNLVLLMPLPFIAVEHYAMWSRRNYAVLGLFGVLAGVFGLAAVSQPPAGVWSAKPANLYNYFRTGQPKCGLAVSGYCSIFDQLNGNVPPGRRLFVLGFYTYWLSEDLLGRLNTFEEYQNILQPNLWQSLYDRGFSVVAVQSATHGRYLTYLRNAPVPQGFEVVEKFADSNMPLFFIQKKTGK